MVYVSLWFEENDEDEEDDEGIQGCILAICGKI